VIDRCLHCLSAGRLPRGGQVAAQAAGGQPATRRSRWDRLSQLGLAQIDLARQDYQSALPRLTESFQITGRLRRPDGIAVVGGTLGQLLMAAGQADQARRVLGGALAAATKLGWTDMARQINELLNEQPQHGEKT
jgi:hypothetical protein